MTHKETEYLALATSPLLTGTLLGVSAYSCTADLHIRVVTLPKVIIELVHTRKGLVAVRENACVPVRLVREHVATIVDCTTKGCGAASRTSQSVFLDGGGYAGGWRRHCNGHLDLCARNEAECGLNLSLHDREVSSRDKVFGMPIEVERVTLECVQTIEEGLAMLSVRDGVG